MTAQLASDEEYILQGGYPTAETARRAFDEADLVRAVSMHRFFFPTVSLEATWRGNLAAGVVPNEVFPLLNGTPQQFVFTPNSDTPYAGLAIDFRTGWAWDAVLPDVVRRPMVVELPPGPLMATANDLNQLWLLDIGLPGRAGPYGGKRLLLPPGYDGDVPDGYYSAVSSTNPVLVLIRALPKGQDMDGAVEFIKSVHAYPLHPRQGFSSVVSDESDRECTRRTCCSAPATTTVHRWTELATTTAVRTRVINPVNPGGRSVRGTTSRRVIGAVSGRGVRYRCLGAAVDRHLAPQMSSR